MKKNALIVCSITLICFLIGGGWHFFAPHDDFIYGLFYRIDPGYELWAWQMLFLYCGPAAGLAALVISLLVLWLKGKKTKPNSPSDAAHE
jgi:hypothetical protein